MSSENARPNRGRKAMPEAMRAALGRPLKKQTDKLPGLSAPTSLPDPPSALDEVALEEWSRVGKYLLQTRRVTELDLQSLTAYCVSWSIFGQSIRPLLIGRKPLWGMVGDTTERPRPSKLEEVARNHGAIVISMARKFGMTARTRHLDHAQTGRPALPNEMHELRGNPSKKSLKADATRMVIDWDEEDTQEPYWFDQVASAEWHRLIKVLSSIDCWTPLDLSVVAIGCSCHSLIIRATEELRRDDVVLPLENKSAVEHPLSKIIRSQRELLEEVWRDYGMTPLDRHRFKHSSGVGQGQSKLKVYLGGAS